MHCISKEFIHPAAAELKCFSKSCPFQHCSSKVDLWLRLLFIPFFSCLPLHLWQLDDSRCTASSNVIQTPFLPHCLPLLFFYPHLPCPERWQGYQSMSNCSPPIHFYQCCAGINSPAPILSNQSTFQPSFSCFSRREKSQLDSLSPQSSASARLFHLPYLENTSSFRFGHLATAITLYDFI